MNIQEWESKSLSSYWCWLFVAGSYHAIEQICREFVLSGLCVTIEPIKYIYSGGAEDGTKIGFIQYARFPTDEEEILKKVECLGKLIVERSGQLSFSIVDPYKTYYWSRADK